MFIPIRFVDFLFDEMRIYSWRFFFDFHDFHIQGFFNGVVEKL